MSCHSVYCRCEQCINSKEKLFEIIEKAQKRDKQIKKFNNYLEKEKEKDKLLLEKIKKGWEE